MKKYLSFVLCYICILAVNAQSYNSVESVEYDVSQNRFFVSNSSSIIQRNSDGSLEFFGNGAASYGMEVLGNTLFVIQGSAVRGYDLVSEEQVMSVTISGAGFLNGMTNNGVDKIYVTDFGANKVHEINVSDLDNPVATQIVGNTGATPNGIVFDGDNNRLIFVTWGAGSIRAIDLTTFNVSTITTTPYSNIDGIDEDNDGNYYISYWSSGSHISKYDADFANAPETITVSGLSSPADICYAKEIDTLAIPHSGNQITFLSFESEEDPCQNGLWDYALGETWVDCGGDCGECQPHANGCQDAGESGIDCGGTSAIPCNSLCNDGLPNGWETAVISNDNQPFECDENLDPIDYLSDNFLEFTDCGGDCGPCATDGVNESLIDNIQLTVFPNPITEKTRISFVLENNAEINLSIYDIQGKLIFTLIDGTQVYGKHQVLLTAVDLPKGVSVVKLRINGELTSFNIMKE